MHDSAIDVHQHLWPDELVDRLRARTRPPYLRGWTLHTDGEPPYVVDPSAHDPQARVAADREAGVGVACVSLSAPLGIESLPRRERRAADRGLAPRASRALPAALPGLGLGAGRSTPTSRGCAASSATPASSASSCRPPSCSRPPPGSGWPRCSRWPRPPTYRCSSTRDRCRARPSTATCRAGGRRWSATPPSSPRPGGRWHAVPGRTLFPRLRLLFAAAAGLAPVHHERHALRGGTEQPVDPEVYVDSSGYGPRALDAVVRVLGIDALVLGSDRPYAEPLTELFGEAATHAVRVTNPARLLGTARAGEHAWPSAS